jgi:histidinol-phosphate aminotransferase
MGDLERPAPEAHQRVAGIPRYQPGRSAEEVMAEHGLEAAVKLASNEAPFGPLPGVLDAVSRVTGSSGRYPDHTAWALRERLAAKHGRSVHHVTVGPGSVGLLQQLLLAFAGPGDEVLFPWPSFIAYPQFTMLAGAAAREAPLSDWRVDVEALLARVTDQTVVVLVANPNNPTSTAIGTAALDRLVDDLPARVLLIVDEAYHEYVTDPDVPDAIRRYGDRANVGVLRTFSKAWGLAGLRVGYLVAAPPVVEAVDAALIPFGVSAPAQAAALAALDAEDEVARRAALVVTERTRLRAELARRGIETPETQGNFVWMPVDGQAAELAVRLERRGVVTRPFPTGIRITIGRPDEDDRLLAALDDSSASTLGEAS